MRNFLNMELFKVVDTKEKTNGFAEKKKKLTSGVEN